MEDLSADVSAQLAADLPATDIRLLRTVECANGGKDGVDMNTEPTPETEGPASVSGQIVATTVGPLSDALGATDAGKVLGVSPRRVRAMVVAGQLEVAHTGPPMKVTRASVERLAATRTESGIVKPGPVPPLDPTQLADMSADLSQVLAAVLKLSGEVDYLRAELRATRGELTTERQHRVELEAAPPPRRRFTWHRDKGTT